MQNISFVHVVYFWLKEGTTETQKQQLIDDCKQYLGTIETVKHLDVGVPAGTPREVVDNSFGVNLIVYFADREGHDYYQQAEKHQEFIERNKEHWARVQVYDTIKK